ncbi:MAG: metal ABC transporter permease [Anaerolineales bacterium]|nr:metal ABC transporter permease [Anaerolineales bacterium]
MLNWILSPLSYAFMQRGLIAVLLVGVVCALVGVYVVLRGMSFFGDALAHAILPGVAIGYIAGSGTGPLVFWGALLSAVLTALGIGAISKSTNIREDTAIGILFSGMFALGVALISSTRSYAVDLSHFLFGDVLGVSNSDLAATLSLTLVVILIVVLFYKELMVLSFDPVLAQTLRLPTRFLENLLLVMIAVTIVVSLQTVGVALMLSMLITPAATAFLLTKRLSVMMVLAMIIAAFSGVVGLFLSYYTGIASGAAIVLICTAFFLIIWGISHLARRNSIQKTTLKNS